METNTLAIRRLKNTRADRELLLDFDEKLSASEQKFGPLFSGSRVFFNSPWRLLFKQKDNAVFVAEKDGTAVGYIVGKIKPVPGWFRGGAYCYIECLYVDEAARGNGVSVKLFEALKNWMKEKGLKTFMLRVFSGNQNAIEIYKKWGFKPYMDQMYMEM